MPVPGEAPSAFLTGFTTITDVASGPDGSLYVLQFVTEAGLAGSGALIRIGADGSRTTMAG